jgi:hypothetical protein
MGPDQGIKSSLRIGDIPAVFFYGRQQLIDHPDDERLSYLLSIAEMIVKRTLPHVRPLGDVIDRGKIESFSAKSDRAASSSLLWVACARRVWREGLERLLFSISISYIDCLVIHDDLVIFDYLV